MHATGTGLGGSGGAVRGMVEKAVLKEGTHLLVLEKVGWCAETAVGWIGRWYKN